MGILLGLATALCWGGADFCARFATRRMSPAERQELHAHCADLERYLAANDVAAYTKTASHFHAAIIEFSRNAYLIEAVNRSVLMLAGLFRFDLTYPDSMRRDLAEHRQMLAAFDAFDAEAARALMRRHALLDSTVVCDYIAYVEATACDGEGSV